MYFNYTLAYALGFATGVYFFSNKSNLFSKKKNPGFPYLIETSYFFNGVKYTDKINLNNEIEFQLYFEKRINEGNFSKLCSDIIFKALEYNYRNIKLIPPSFMSETYIKIVMDFHNIDEVKEDLLNWFPEYTDFIEKYETKI